MASSSSNEPLALPSILQEGHRRMKFAFGMPHLAELKATMQPWELSVTGADQTRLAKLADSLGYDMLSVPEHFIIPDAHTNLSGAHYFHAYAGMGYYAGATERIKVNSCIAILPLQHPVVTAKALSTIDWMSGGRAMVTFGAGWLKEEFDLLGVDFHKRGRICDEYLAAIVELWTKNDPVFEGEFISFIDVAFAPKPVQKPHLPIWMGGEADAVLKRAARFASGWWPYLSKPEDIPSRIDFIKSQPEFDGRSFDVMYGFGTSRIGEGHKEIDDPKARPGKTAAEIIDRLNWFAELGVTMSSVPIPAVRDIAEYEDYVRWVIQEIKPNVC
jgi:probable F420-dependent oxidoreductase